MGYKHGETGLSVLLGKEAIPGTESSWTTTRKLGLIQNFSSRTGFEQKSGKTTFSQDVAYQKSGRKIAEFDVEFFIQNFWWLYPICGGETYQVDIPSAGFNTHTLTQSNLLPSYSAELIDDDLGVSTKLFGEKANDFSLKCPDGGELLNKMTWKGMDFDKDVTPVSAAEDATDPWLFDHLTLITMNAQEKKDVNVDLTWNYNRNVEARTGKGSKVPVFVKESGRVHEIIIDQYQDDMETFDLVANETDFITVLNFVKTVSEDQLVATFNQCRVFDPGHSRPGDDALKENFSIFPYAKAGQTLLDLPIIDTQTEYATA